MLTGAGAGAIINTERERTTEDKTMLTNKERYEREINTVDEYRITIAEFTGWLNDNKMTQRFTETIKAIKTEEDGYTVAVDYSIPMIMVKYFQRRA